MKRLLTAEQDESLYWTQGYQGYQGYYGYQGDQGYQGYQGDQGYQDNQGYQGDQGYQGIRINSSNVSEFAKNVGS